MDIRLYGLICVVIMRVIGKCSTPCVLPGPVEFESPWSNTGGTNHSISNCHNSTPLNWCTLLVNVIATSRSLRMGQLWQWNWQCCWALQSYLKMCLLVHTEAYLTWAVLKMHWRLCFLFPLTFTQALQWNVKAYAFSDAPPNFSSNLSTDLSVCNVWSQLSITWQTVAWSRLSSCRESDAGVVTWNSGVVSSRQGINMKLIGFNRSFVTTANPWDA